MCQRDRLANEFFILNAIIVITAFITISSGANIASNEYLTIAYGSGLNSLAKGITFMGFLSLCSAGNGLYSSKSHNRFCILLYLLVMGTSVTLVLVLSAAISQNMESPFDPVQSLDCTKVVGEKEVDCSSITSSEHYSKLRDVWQTIHLRSIESEDPGSYLLLLENIQTDGQCCGFDQPLGCAFGETSTSMDPKNVTSSLELPTICGPQLGWYQPSYYCEVILDPPENIACPFFLPGGTCVAIGHTSGCADQVEKWLVSAVAPHIRAAQYSTTMHILGLVVGLFMFLKKKPDDVLPTEYTTQHADDYAQRYSLYS